MKQLFRHTSILLRTALLLGALTFVGTQQTKAQTAEQWAAMPDAFETMDPASIIGDGNYYYIQFYTPSHDKCSYLTDRGEDKLAAVMDFLPYANNRLWTLERVNGNDFKLKSKAGYYIGFDRKEGASGNRYVSITNSDNATTFTFQQARNNDGYNIVDKVHGYNNGEPPSLLGRSGNDSPEWLTGLSPIRNDNTGKDNSRMRFAKLKSNAAFIIYYRDEGADNSDPSASTIRHYLTYSDVDAASTVMASAVTNGSLEGADASSFYFGDPDHDDPFVASITDGAGNNDSRGIQITARGKASPNDWDTQFFISADEVIPEGTTFHLEFDYRANRNATVPTQAHSAPGSYITEMPNINGISNLSFTTNWQTYSADITVSHEMGYGRGNDKGNSFQTIAFNLWRERSTNPNTIYYFDNIKLTVPTSGSAVSSRRSIIPPDKPLSTLPTIAAYHQDGLWQLEEASADGKFYIKKYDSNEYLNCDLADPNAAALAVLGPKDGTHGQYSLVDPVASRYTLVQNVQYQTAALSPDMFYHWNGYGADANIDGQHGNVDFFFQLGQQLNSGDAVAGTGGVDYVRYADLTGYTTMIIKGTPGMVVRVLMNRQESNSGPYTLRELTIGNDGKVELDLTDIKNDAGYVHLNAIKIGWGNSGIINDVELVNRNQVNNSSPLYLNHSNGDGYPVMERSDDAANHWYAAFYPVEVPVPNKDDYFQVLVRWGDNMINHAGGAEPLPANVSDYDLWQLEQVDDYKHFRLKDPSGRYLKPGGSGVTEPNNPDGAETNTNEKFWTDFALTWYYVNPVPKEIPVDYMITHRMSYLKDYTTQYQGLELDRQGLTTDADSYWWNYDSETQKVNHFEITHYVKQGQTITVPLPTILNASNDHVYYQRWYHYNDTTCNNVLYPDGTDLEGLKSHVSVNSRDDGDVQYFLYKNGMVTGQKLDWTGIEQSSYKRNVQRNFYFTNSDGKAFTVAADVSRYSDFTYENESNPLQGDLEEPSLTMRYIYYMRDAKTMAAQLTACAPGTDKWLETKTFHFPARQIFYESQKKAGYRGEFIGLRHLFSDYWVFENSSYADAYNEGIAYNLEHPEDQRDLTYLDEYLRSAVTSKSSGRIEVEIVDDATYPTGIRKGGWNPNIDRYGFNDGNDADYEGFYFYDMMDFQNVTDAKASYGDSRFIVFRYPASRMVNVPTDPNVKQEAKINVYLNYNGTKYQLAQFTIIFDPGTVTLPYKQINGTSPYVLDNDFKDRDPKALVDKAGEPIAKVTFDYPTGDKYHFPAKGSTKQGWWEAPADASIDNSSPIPLIFDKTNYAYMGFECNWGSYSIVTQMTTNYGNHQNAMPANDNTYGYGHADYPALQADPYLQNGFLYIDASEQPGDICSAPFVGDFCAGDKLMFSGWISGSNKAGGGDNRCPGGITLTVKGEHKVNGKMQTETLYRFCPGQIYELDNNTGTPDGSGVDGEQWLKNAQGQYIDNNGNVVDEEHRVPNPNYDNNKYYVVWQQFYFEFLVTDKYDRHWIEVNNNCVSSKGGDFMLDNIEVYAIVPEVEPEINTPLCVSLDKDGNTVTEMRLLKLSVDFNKLKSSSGVNDGATENPQLGFVFLDKYKFLETFRTELAALTDDDLRDLHLSAFIDAENPNHNKFNTITLDELAAAIEDGELESITGDNEAYQHAFDAAILGNKTTWYSNKPEEYEAKKNSSILYFEWDPDFEDMPLYSFSKAVNKTSPVYREVVNGVKRVVMNGNFPQLDWKINTDYYIVDTNVPFTSGSGKQYSTFNICSECSKTSTFRIESPYTVLGLEKSEETSDYIVCEGQIPTIALNLKGYDLKGNEVDMKNLNFDWWLGKKGKEADNTTNPVTPAEPPVLATLEKYHDQKETIDGEEVRLDKALATLRAYYPAATSLDGIIPQTEKNPFLTGPMIKYLKKLVAAGELVLHQTSVSVPAEKVSNDDPYFYIVACPIHDEAFNQALNPAADEYVAYFCDEPQGLRIKVGEKAPTLKTGFVPGENTFLEYNYPESDPILSIRLAKKAQFETVQHGKVSEAPNDGSSNTDLHYLWLPIRNAQTQTAGGVIKKSDDYNVYLASTNDPTWDKEIYKSMNKYDNDGNYIGSLPIVGKIVQLYGKNINNQDGEPDDDLIAAQNDVNRLCIYFIKYLTDAEEDEEGKVFEVREGYNYMLSLPFQEEGDVNACDGTILINLKIVPDYEVWTGAAGNPDWNNDENWRRADGNTEDNSGVNADELYVGAASTDSPLYGYKTNKWNYRTPKDRVFRKGFAPLYCTHVLLMTDEWGNAPVLYDGLDGQNSLTASPFPNLRDWDGWDGTAEETEPTKATATPILRYDMQARLYDIWEDTYGEGVVPNKGRPGDLIAEMYQINSCDEIAFQPGTELLNAHLLNYNNAWSEYKLDNKRWYLLGSSLQGTISGEWYAPTGKAQQKTTYYDDVTFGEGYDRYSPAIYQRSWDKAKAVLYEVGSTYDKNDDRQDTNLGTEDEGIWSGNGNSATWAVENGGTADEYLDRLGYKPMGGKKANVAIKGIWSNTYNDAQVDYANGGFSVMIMNHLKNNDSSNGNSIIRLPKEDTMYDYYEFSETGASGNRPDGRTETDLSIVRTKDRALNRGRLKTDLLLPNSTKKLEKEADSYKYGDRRTFTRIPIRQAELIEMNNSFVTQNATTPATAGFFSEIVPIGESSLGYYLVENPFPCGLNMEKFFAANPKLLKKYWLLTATGQHLVQYANGQWVSPTVEDENDATILHFATSEAVLAPGQGFFVQADTDYDDPDMDVNGDVTTTTIAFNLAMQAQSRYGVESGTPRTFKVEVGREQVTEEVTETITLDDGTTEEVTYEQVVYEDDGVTPKTKPIEEDVTLYTYIQTSDNDYKYPLKARTRGDEDNLAGLVITAERGDIKSSALVREHNGASNDFLPSEDTETFITSDLENVPTVYTLCGRLATTINSIHDFRSLPIGVESNSDAPCTLTFKGVEMLGDSIAFYDALEQKLTPLKSGMTVSVSGQTQNRYYLVRSLIQEEAAAETHLQIFTEGLTAKVIASTAEPITSVRCYDTAGRLIHSASPQTPEYSFSLPIAGIYIISAETENDRKTIKLMVK